MVVGAGIVGCAVAYELARRGASVEIVDERGVGLGATQASAGMLAPYSEAPDGGPLGDITARALAVFDGFVQTLEAHTRSPLNYSRSGTLEVASSDADLSRLRQVRTSLAARGVTVQWLDADDVHEREPALGPAVRGGLAISGQGFVAVTELTRALVAAARTLGARVIEQGRVHRIEASGREMSVVTERGRLSSDAVVLAAGSWSGRIAVGNSEVTLPVKPIRGQLLQLQWTGAPLTQVIWSERCYVVPWADGTVLVGATVEDVGFDERTTVEGVRTLIAAVSDLLPAANFAAFTAARAGLRPLAPDHLPIVGRSTALPGLVYATAHYRNGVLLAPLTATLLADLLLEGRHDPMLDVMSPTRWKGL